MLENQYLGFSAEEIDKLSEKGGKDIDLVAVDYNLGQEDIDGAKVASSLRAKLHYTDMVFYSVSGTTELYSRLAEESVFGIFVSSRDDLDDALIGLADTVIGKAVDLNHMRGIAMAAVAEMDTLLEDTLSGFFESGDPLVKSVSDRTIAKAKSFQLENAGLIEQKYADEGIISVIRDGRLFSAVQKFWALRRICNRMTSAPELGVLSTYESEILRNRNLLAHAKESEEDGVLSLQATGPDGEIIAIDDAWLANLRITLRKHLSQLNIVCSEVSKRFQ